MVDAIALSAMSHVWPSLTGKEQIQLQSVCKRYHESFKDHYRKKICQLYWLSEVMGCRLAPSKEDVTDKEWKMGHVPIPKMEDSAEKCWNSFHHWLNTLADHLAPYCIRELDCYVSLPLLKKLCVVYPVNEDLSEPLFPELNTILERALVIKGDLLLTGRQELELNDASADPILLHDSEQTEPYCFSVRVVSYSSTNWASYHPAFRFGFEEEGSRIIRFPKLIAAAALSNKKEGDLLNFNLLGREVELRCRQKKLDPTSLPFEQMVITLCKQPTEPRHRLMSPEMSDLGDFARKESYVSNVSDTNFPSQTVQTSTVSPITTVAISAKPPQDPPSGCCAIL